MAVSSHALTGEYVSVDGANGYLVQPVETAQAGVLLLPHVDGLKDEMRETAAEFAGLGYAAFVWDPYPGVNADVTPREQLPPLADDDTCKEQSRCLSYLRETVGVQRVGAIGWCMGGRMALVFAAREPRLNACVAFFPSMRTERKAGEVDASVEAANTQCPLQVHWGTHDHVTSPATFNRYRDAVAASKHPTCINVFPGADHGFLNPERHNTNPANIIATKISWPQTLAFFDSNLSPEGH